MKKRTIHYAVAAAFAAASLASNVAHAVVEAEPNELTTAAPQPLVIVNGGAEVTGSIGAITTSVDMTTDLDFYSFEGTEGDMVTIAITGGMKDFGSTSRSVDTILGLFGPDRSLVNVNDDDLETGSSDARIANARLPATGTYIVGVSSFPRMFLDGGQGSVANPTALTPTSNGSYTLTISGVSMPAPAVLVQPINIDIKPRHAGVTRIYPHADDKISVALLSSSSYDALKVDRASVTFGATGDEASLVRCHNEPIDVNRDGYKDLVCRFDLRKAGFEVGDLEGVVKGTMEGKPFEGHAPLKVVQPGKKRKHGDREHGDRGHDRNDGNRGHGGRD
jgi:pre-peptidase